MPTGEGQAKGRWGYCGMQESTRLFLHKSRHQKAKVYCQISRFLEACFGGRLLQRDSQSHILRGSSCVSLQMGDTSQTPGEHPVFAANVGRLQRCEAKKPWIYMYCNLLKIMTSCLTFTGKFPKGAIRPFSWTKDCRCSVVIVRNLGLESYGQ